MPWVHELYYDVLSAMFFLLNYLDFKENLGS